MIIRNFQAIACLSTLCFALAGADVQPNKKIMNSSEVTPLEVDYPKIGTIKPRHAREIESSRWSIGAETMDRDYTIYANWREYLGPLGAKRARIQSGWAKTDDGSGDYDWVWLDEIILDMVDQGVEPWVCLCYGNQAYEGGGTEGLGGALPESEESLQAWEKFVAAFVQRYGEYVDEWEIWNEPKNYMFDDGSYQRYFTRTAEVIREHQPAAVIIGPSTIGIKMKQITALLDHLKAEDKLDLVDQVAIHPYDYNPDAKYGGYERLRETLAEYDQRITIRQGENGAPSGPAKHGILRDHPWTPENQAKWALRRLLGDAGRDIRPTNLFAMCDMIYSNDRLNSKGLLAADHDKNVLGPKPSYFAAQNLFAVFDDRTQPQQDLQYTLATEKPEDYSLFGQATDTGEWLISLWRDADVPGENAQREQFDLQLPEVTFQQPVFVDLLTGNVYNIPEEMWSIQDGGTRFQQIPVYDSPVLIAEKALLPISTNF